MHTFLAAFSRNRSSSDLQALVTRAERSMMRLLPDSAPCGLPVPQSAANEQRVAVAFWGMAPKESGQRLLSTACTGDVLVLAFGELLDSAELAQSILGAYLSRGIEAVRELDGSFGALIVDYHRRAVWLLSDLLGWRSLRFVEKDDLLLVSPHDVVLVSSGEVALDYDLDALASMVIADHSLQGRSLLKAVQPCHAAFAQVWRGQRVERAGRFGLELSCRISASDERAIEKQQDEVVQALSSAAARFTQRHPKVIVELTAGLDSRAVFALLCGAAPGATLSTVTSGEESNLEVSVAKRLSAMRQVPHRTRGDIQLNMDAAAEHIRQRALACNGDTNAKRALSRPPRYQDEAQASGICGELYRGFYYPYFGLTGSIPNDPEQIAKTLMRFRFRRLPGLRFADGDQKARFASLFRETLFDLSVHAPSGADLTDLFYLFERCGRWGAKSMRFSRKPLFIPYASTEALRAAYQLPSPVGQHCAVQVELLRRYFPASLNIPLNGGSYPALEGAGRARYVLRQLLTLKGKALHQWRAKVAQAGIITKKKAARSMPSLQAAAIAGPLYDYARESLTRGTAMSPQLFGMTELSGLLETHRAHQSQLQVLGFLLTAEAFNELCREAQQSC